MAGNNTNIVHVEAIENLCSAIQGELKDLEPATATEFEVKNEAREYLHLYQAKQVKALRNAFEDN